VSVKSRPQASTPEPAPVRPGAEPFAGGDGDVGVLLCHGFTGSPASMRPWAEHLVAAGYRVRVPRLPGHGTTWQELNLTRWQDWYSCVNRALVELAAETRTVVVGGLSMGGALALRLAEEHSRPLGPDRYAVRVPIAGLCLVNPALTNLDPRLRLLPVLKHLSGSVAGISGDIAKPFVDEVAYGRTPLKALASMVRFWQLTIDDLHRVRQPILLFRSVHDHVVEPASGRILRERVASTEIIERELQKSFHVATLDYDADLIFAESAEFIASVTTAAKA
jgi:carboxylesterase